MGLATTALFILFIFAAIVLIVVILLQEGKGGGFGQALGEHGQATFGVGASGITKFTAVTAIIFLVSALGIHVLTRQATGTSLLEFDSEAPSVVVPGETDGAEAPVIPAGNDETGK